MHFADTKTSEIIVVVDRCNKHLERFVYIARGRRYFRNNSIKQRFKRRSLVFQFTLRNSLFGDGVDGRKIQLLFVGAERQEQFEHFVQHNMGAGIFTVDLVDNNDRLKVQVQ